MSSKPRETCCNTPSCILSICNTFLHSTQVLCTVLEYSQCRSPQMLQAFAERASTEGFNSHLPLKLRGGWINNVINTSDVGSGFYNELRSEGSKLMPLKGLIPWSMHIFAIRKIFLTSSQNFPSSRFKLIIVFSRVEMDISGKAPWIDPQLST